MKALTFDGVAPYPNLASVADYGKQDTVCIELKASALNHRDLWIMKGMYADLTPGAIMGADGMGTIGSRDVVVYPGIEWGVSERIMSEKFRALGMPDHGTFADKLYTKPEYVFDKPAHLSDVEAAALPLAGLTAYRALFARGHVKRGDNVLITGVGGGVAMMALSLAVALGCNVFVSSGDEEKISKAIKLGALGGVNYKDDTWHKKLLTLTKGIDVIIDGAAGADFNKYLSVCNHGASIVVYGGTAGKIQNVSPQSLFWKQLSILGSTMGSLKDFSDMLAFVNEYKVQPIIDTVFSFENYKLAFDKLASGNHFGKIVLKH